MQDSTSSSAKAAEKTDGLLIPTGVVEISSSNKRQAEQAMISNDQDCSMSSPSTTSSSDALPSLNSSDTSCDHAKLELKGGSEDVTAGLEKNIQHDKRPDPAVATTTPVAMPVAGVSPERDHEPDSSMNTRDPKVRKVESHDDYFFSEYDNLAVHKLMLTDKARMDAYSSAILQLKEKIEGKNCIDVGTGTSILAMLMVKLGNCKHIHAIEACPKVGAIARKLLEANPELKKRITLWNCKVEEVPVLESDNIDGSEASFSSAPSTKTPKAGIVKQSIDVIVSEWMGFHLLHEGVLDTILFARDRFLKPDTGLIMPDTCEIFCAPMDLTKYLQESKEETLGYFHPDSFFGLAGFEDLFGRVRSNPLYEPPHLHEEPDVVRGIAADELFVDITTEEFNKDPFVSLDLYKCQPRDLDRVERRIFRCTSAAQEQREANKSEAISSEDASIVEPNRFVCEKDGIFGAVGIWFKCIFPAPGAGFSEKYPFEHEEDKAKKRIVLSTSPEHLMTHWKQTILFLKNPEDNDRLFNFEAKKGDLIEFGLALKREPEENNRHYEIEFEM